MTDDWGRPLGSDPETVVTPRTKTSRQDTIPGLVSYFADLLPRDAWGTLNTPVNHRALGAGISKLKKAGHTSEQIRGMMESFVQGLARKPLPMGIAPWRGFLANLDVLSNKATKPKEQSYDDLEIDPRI